MQEKRQAQPLVATFCHDCSFQYLIEIKKAESQIVPKEWNRISAFVVQSNKQTTICWDQLHSQVLLLTGTLTYPPRPGQLSFQDFKAYDIRRNFLVFKSYTTTVYKTTLDVFL